MADRGEELRLRAIGFLRRFAGRVLGAQESHALERLRGLVDDRADVPPGVGVELALAVEA